VKRHRTDILALLFGLAFVSVGASFLVSELSDAEVDAAWVSATAFITIGFVALAATFLRRRPDEVAALAPATVEAAAIEEETVVPAASHSETVQAELDSLNEADLT
jgi:hypothetical protein